MIGRNGESGLKRLKMRFFLNAKNESKANATIYCVEDCKRCKNDDCLFGRKAKKELS